MNVFKPFIQWITLTLMLAPAHADCCKNSVAVIAQLTGPVVVRLPGRPETTPVSIFDWVPEGATLYLGANSRVIVILSNGHRYELDQGAKATFTSNAAPKITGPARELSPLPPIPKPGVIVADAAPTAGGVRIRGEDEMSELYPNVGAVAIADGVTLQYKAMPDASSYQVALENEAGDTLLNVTTDSRRVWVSKGTLDPGAHYYWRVHALRSGVSIGSGTAEFTTLSAEDALERTEFASALRTNAEDDPAALALVAEVDLRLGLLAEACDEFSAALKQKPGDVTLQHALDSTLAKLAGERK